MLWGGYSTIRVRLDYVLRACLSSDARNSRRVEPAIRDDSILFWVESKLLGQNVSRHTCVLLRPARYPQTMDRTTKYCIFYRFTRNCLLAEMHVYWRPLSDDHCVHPFWSLLLVQKINLKIRFNWVWQFWTPTANGFKIGSQDDTPDQKLCIEYLQYVF